MARVAPALVAPATVTAAGETTTGAAGVATVMATLAGAEVPPGPLAV